MISESPSPIAVIGFTSSASPLEPVWPSTHRALLPIAGKPLIVHLVEQLARDGIRHLRLAGSIQQYAVRKRLRDGSEWGLKIRYSDLHGVDLRLQTLLEHDRCLYLCGDDFHIGGFGAPRKDMRSAISDPSIGAELPSYWELGPDGPARFGIRIAAESDQLHDPLMTVRSYHNANLKAVAWGTDRLTLPGRAVAAGITIDWDTSIASDAVLGTAISIGKHCRIDRRVHLEARCVIGNGVIIGRGSCLRNVTVLPNTYIGARTRLRDAVIAPQGIFSLDGQFLASPNRAVIGRARRNSERQTGIPSEKLSVLERAARKGRKLFVSRKLPV